jgi:hypothetical protein
LAYGDHRWPIFIDDAFLAEESLRRVSRRIGARNWPAGSMETTEALAEVLVDALTAETPTCCSGPSWVGTRKSFMWSPSDAELLRELEYEFAAVARRRRRPRVRMVHERSVQRESEWDSFDPSPPSLGTTILPHFDTPRPGGETAPARLKSFHLPIIERFARAVTSGMAATPIGSTIRIDVEGHEDETGDPALYGFPGLERAKAVAPVLNAASWTSRRSFPRARGAMWISSSGRAGPSGLSARM